MTRDIQIWVDFNDVDDDFMITSLRNFSNFPMMLEEGMTVTCRSDDSIRCKAIITKIDGESVKLKLLTDQGLTPESP